jgi:hypothetical protein
MTICRFSAFWKTPPEKVENRSQVFDFGFENFFSANYPAGWGH